MSRTFHTKLSGTSHKNDDGTDRQTIIRNLVKPAQPLILISEPDNQFDKFAIGAWINCNGALHQVGYLDSRLAAEVTRLMARKGAATATIQTTIGGTAERPTLGVVIEITKFDPADEIVQQSANTPVVTQAPFIAAPPSPAAYSIGYVVGRFLRKFIP